VVPGGGVALIRCLPALDGLKLKGDEQYGVDLLKSVLEIPLRTIASNAGVEGAVVANKIKKSADPNFGYDALNDRYGDVFSFGIVDPAKVTRSALQNAASVACLLLTTESIVVEEPKDESEKDGHHDHHHDDMGMGGMGGMGGMM
jgi:chaperonin GroEL